MTWMTENHNRHSTSDLDSDLTLFVPHREIYSATAAAKAHRKIK